MIHLGVSSCFMYPDPSRAVFGHKTLAYFEQDMARYLSRPGVLPILIPDLPEEDLMKYLDQMDGFVFQGGSDIAPSTYNEEPIANGRWPGDPQRDQYELIILDYAYKRRRPVFAICRGMQLVNVFFGGTLYQDLKTCITESHEHRNPEIYDKVMHELTCTPDGLLKKLYHSDRIIVNSVHHQGIKTLGKGLVKDAITQDNLTEAFHYEDMDNHFILGVQWHPEFSHTLGDKVADPEPLYDYFLEAVQREKLK